MTHSFEARDAMSGDARGEPVFVRWSGSPWDLVGLSFVNFFLTIITLGIYGFWGRTEVRRRIWSSIRLQDEPLAYTGTGGELFKGFLFVVLVVFIPGLLILFAAAAIFGDRSIAYGVTNLAVYMAYFLLMGIAIYRARRYRLTRTVWRGIRGGMSGSPTSFAWLWIWTTALIPVTLGWILPWRANRLQAHLGRETTFGDRHFAYAGSSSRLYGPFAVLWVGGPILVAVLFALVAIIGVLSVDGGSQASMKMPSLVQVVMLVGIFVLGMLALSVIGAWYRSRTFNLFAAYTGFDRAKLGLRTTAWGLIGLALSNFLITIFSLGILRPVAQARAAKYLIDRLSIDGTVDVTGILQSQAALGKGGEGLAQMFDVDAF